MQCRCMGLALVRLPQKLPATLNQLTVVQANLLKLRLVGLLRFAATLQDMYVCVCVCVPFCGCGSIYCYFFLILLLCAHKNSMLTDVPLFETIEPGALGHCRQLRTL